MFAAQPEKGPTLRAEAAVWAWNRGRRGLLTLPMWAPPACGPQGPLSRMARSSHRRATFKG
eukprot:8838399-Alexandrium_andersonii.AAC.1